jgi:hypothetical protein
LGDFDAEVGTNLGNLVLARVEEAGTHTLDLLEVGVGLREDVCGRVKARVGQSVAGACGDPLHRGDRGVLAGALLDGGRGGILK